MVERIRASSIVFWVVFAAALGVILLTAYTSITLFRTVECQSRLNESFLAVLRSNSEASQLDRDNLNDLIHEVTTATDDSDTILALREYEERRVQIDEQRRDYPGLPTELC